MILGESRQGMREITIIYDQIYLLSYLFIVTLLDCEIHRSEGSVYFYNSVNRTEDTTGTQLKCID